MCPPPVCLQQAHSMDIVYNTKDPEAWKAKGLLPFDVSLPRCAAQPLMPQNCWHFIIYVLTSEYAYSVCFFSFFDCCIICSYFVCFIYSKSMCLLGRMVRISCWEVLLGSASFSHKKTNTPLLTPRKNLCKFCAKFCGKSEKGQKEGNSPPCHHTLLQIPWR